ncbi:hypothetical protein EDB82DRAFT_502356 [Fusarium venenatum]|uniref:uncharacterized protein n=1 Tax=Fusarium venenatum TaxID=56646 RepID=UPI001D9D3D6D|nr:hypothetical protein EDB82DRAFT_502356 [Fusarium venenatum]
MRYGLVIVTSSSSMLISCRALTKAVGRDATGPATLLGVGHQAPLTIWSFVVRMRPLRELMEWCVSPNEDSFGLLLRRAVG